MISETLRFGCRFPAACYFVADRLHSTQGVAYSALSGSLLLKISRITNDLGDTLINTYVPKYKVHKI